MTLLSCPPISMIVRASGASWWTPRAWQVISVMVVSVKRMASRVLQKFFKKFRRQPFLLHALVGQTGSKNLHPLGVEQHRLDGTRARVYAGANHVKMLKAKC
jgi:hypothetical protein